MKNMERGGDVITVHKDLVAAMEREGWVPVEGPKADPEADPKADTKTTAKAGKE